MIQAKAERADGMTHEEVKAKADYIIGQFKIHAHHCWDDATGYDDESGIENATHCALISVRMVLDAHPDLLATQEMYEAIETELKNRL